MRRHTPWPALVRMHARWLITAVSILSVLVLAVGTTNTALAANAAANLDQCANGPVGGIAPCLNGSLSGTSYSDWVNGNVNSSKAHWSEGQFISYRTTLTGLTSGDHTLVFDYKTVHSSKHALDYIGSYDYTEKTQTSPTGSATSGNFNNNNPCVDKLGSGPGSGCTPAGTPPTPTDKATVPPADLAGETTCGGAAIAPGLQTPGQIAGTIDMFAPTEAGATFPTTNAVQYVSQNVVSGTGQCSTTMSVTFNLSGAAPSAGWTVVLAWGGHIASALDWGVGNSASAVSGSPYHMALDSLDGASTGAQDRALSAAAVAPPPTIATQVSATSISAGDSLTDTATLTGTNGTVTGTVDFVLCSNTTTGCPQGSGVLVQSGVPLVNGTATSGNLDSPNLAAGNYCVGLVYHNDTNSFYSSTYSGSATNECFTVNAASITVTKTADAATVNAGDPIGFTVTIGNSGAGTAHGVSLSDALPAGSGTGVTWAIDPSSPNASAFAITGSAGSQALVLVGQPIDVAAGTTLTVHITAMTSASECSTYDNTATVTSTNDGGGSSEATITCNQANLTVTKTADAATVNAGDPIGYTITVNNSGAGVAHSVQITDTLPTNSGLNWTVASVNPSTVQCTITSGVLTCTVGDLAAGASASVHLTSPTTAATCGTVTNTASATSSNDGNPTSDPATITVNCANLTITKTADAATVNAGDPIGFKIVVTNSGAGTAHGVSLNDPLPAGVVWAIDAANTSAQSCTISGGVLTCGPQDLAANESYQVHITAMTSASECSIYDNTATVTSTNDGGGSSEATITCNQANLTVTKTADAATVNAGDPIGFTVTIGNSGAGTAHGVSLSDALPAGSGTGVTWAIDPSSPNASAFAITGSAGSQALVLVGQPIDVAAGTTLTVHITAMTSASECSTYDNTATVTSTNDGSANASASITCNQQVSQITPTGTTCGQFASGTAETLSTLNYLLKGNKIGSVAPGVFFYWVKVTVSGPGSHTYTINQSTDKTSNLFAIAAGSNVYDSACNVVKGNSITQSSSDLSKITVTFDSTAGGTFYIGVKFSTSNVVGETNPGTVTYTYSTGDVPGSTSTIQLVKKAK